MRRLMGRRSFLKGILLALGGAFCFRPRFKAFAFPEEAWKIEATEKPQRPRVGIVGGGLAGLTCAYKLNQKGIPVTVLEKESKVGGRAWHAVAYNSAGYKALPGLIKELGITSEIIRVQPEQMGLWHDGRLIRATIPSLLKFYGPIDFFTMYWKIMRKLESLTFDYDNPSQKLKELHQMSILDWCREQKLPEQVVEAFIQPFAGFCYKTDLRKIAADWALWILNDAFGKVYTLKRDMISIALKLAEVLGLNVITGAEVFHIAEAGTGFKIRYLKNNSPITLNVDILVLALPITVINKLMPELNLHWNYSKTQSLIVKGEPVHNNLAFVSGTDKKNPDRIRFILSRADDDNPAEKRFDGKTKEIQFYDDGMRDFHRLFQNGRFEIIKEVKLDPATAVPSPGATFLELKQRENLYICGDFYRLTSTEAAITSGMKVAEMITKPLIVEV